MRAGIAQMIRVGLFRSVHVKTLQSQQRRMLLTTCKLLQSKMCDLENDLRGTLKNFGFKVGKVGAARFEARVRELVDGYPTLRAMVIPVLLVLTEESWTCLRRFPRLQRQAGPGVAWKTFFDPDLEQGGNIKVLVIHFRATFAVWPVPGKSDRVHSIGRGSILSAPRQKWITMPPAIFAALTRAIDKGRRVNDGDGPAREGMAATSRSAADQRPF
jgi:hypothetical protein